MSGTRQTSLEFRISSKVHAKFDALPPNCKPRVHPNGIREWIPLSAVVLVANEDTQDEEVTVVSIATGAKCLSMSQLDKCNGLVLHDSHAEILALRGFNYWLLKECKVALSKESILDDGKSTSPTASKFLEYCSFRKTSYRLDLPIFQLSSNISIYMYGTCAPCGDASMELTMAAQEDATPWDRAENRSDCSTGTPSLLDGRGYFSHLGVVRRKPSRADAEPTLSKSCSDKLAMKQVTSALSAITSVLVKPTANAYIKGLILPENEVSDTACARAFGDGETGRLRQLKDSSWTVGSLECAFRPFTVFKLPDEQAEALWQYGKPKDRSVKTKIGNVSVSWIAGPSNGEDRKETREVIINGVKQGSHISSPNPKKGSVLCRAKMWNTLEEIVNDLSTHCNTSSAVPYCFAKGTYKELKGGTLTIPSCAARRMALTAGRTTLSNWVENRGDADWGLTVLNDNKVAKRAPVACQDQSPKSI
ncbi:Adenosine deaminase/editase [Ascosphaera apis ARSEF 7405]|uniref:Adenosine deaminase/editase n=1 Tax=Ascosphaera apis ARSEF 7405 TaxID=392613 RepID=A0A167WAM6_9EURO|nr:Adenosine deaminase/editase [Ascosphaera apis ARSEF 7405]